VASTEEEVGWDEDSDDETSKVSKPKGSGRPSSTASSTTLHPAIQDAEDRLPWSHGSHTTRNLKLTVMQVMMSLVRLQVLQVMLLIVPRSRERGMIVRKRTVRKRKVRKKIVTKVRKRIGSSIKRSLWWCFLFIGVETHIRI
jgi:hypothetical protein